jgi:uncharacterized membrane protein YhaH (DUF805 family)
MYPSEKSRSGNRGLWLLLGLLTVICVALFMIPAFVIRPFTHQSARGLWLAIAVKRIAPVVSVIALLALLAVAVRLWQRSSTWLRVAVVPALLLSLFATVMVRQNYFEWMFNPIKTAGFVSPNDAKLSDQEMVMAVRIGSEARAYPILQMAYHHVLNDAAAGVPLVVTY